MSDDTRTPRLLVPLARTKDSPEAVTAALYQELQEVDPYAAARVDPTSIPYLSGSLDQNAPDGWYFGVRAGSYGFWPADLT